MIRKKSNINVYVKRPKIKVMNFMAMIITITWKWRLETRRRFPTWWFGWSTRTHQYWRSGSTRVIYSPVSTAYRTHNLKYPKVYLSLKTFKSLIEHSWFFFTPLQFPFCSAMARDLRNPPYHPPLMSSVNFLSVFQFLDFQSTERADRKNLPPDLLMRLILVKR